MLFTILKKRTRPDGPPDGCRCPAGNRESDAGTVRDTAKYGTIVADETRAISKPGVFAGGDIVTGSATVILAMGAGKVATKAIDEYVRGLSECDV